MVLWTLFSVIMKVILICLSVENTSLLSQNMLEAPTIDLS